MNKYKDDILRYSFFLISIIIFIVCLIGGVYWNYAYKLDISKSNVYIFLIACLIFGVILKIIFILNNTIRKLLRVNTNIWIVLISVFFFIIQILLVYNYYFRTGWDSFMVVEGAYILSEHRTLPDWGTNYFSNYPNNLFIMILFSKIIFICKVLGLADFSYFIILIFQSILNVCTGILIFKVINKLTQTLNLSILGYILYVVLIGLSPWVSIPYSDSVALVIPVLILYLYIGLKDRQLKYIRIICISSLGVLGYMLKPQITIILISVLIVSILYIEKLYFKKIIKKVSIGLISILISYVFINNFISNENIRINKESEISFTHFIKMGLNNSTDGGYSWDDVNRSKLSKNKEERREENIVLIKERVREYGKIGLLKHQIKKTLNNYNDGTFAWSLEGNFYFEIYKKENKIVNGIRSIYYEKGTNYYIFKYFTQGTWLIILSIQPLNIFIKRKNMDNNMRVVLLSLIGLFIFESIFEARARYLYTYVPIFIVSGMIGLNGFINWMKKR